MDSEKMTSPTTQNFLKDDQNVEPKAYVESLKKRRAELEEELHALGTCQNLFSRPNRLPTEVLEQVFMEHALEVYFDCKVDDKLRWVGILQVCRHWRDVAVNYAPLWTRIVLSHPEFIKLMLTRSKGALLSFDFNSEQLNYYRKADQVSAAKDILTEMLFQTERFRSLSLNLRYHRGRDIPLTWILRRATGCAPHLEDLTIVGYRNGMKSMPPNFLGGGAPSLQRLTLEHASIPWEQIPLPETLTQLILRGAYYRPSSSEFYNALARLVSLETLILEGKVPPADDSTTPLSTCFALPRLKTLHVGDFTGELIRFFEVVRVRSIGSMKVTIYGGHDSPAEASAVDQCLEKFRSAIDGALRNLQDTVNRLCIHNFDRGDEDTFGRSSVELRCEPHLEEACPSDRPCLSITVQFGQVPPLIADFLPSFRKHFDLKTIKTLDVINSRDLTADVLLDTFARLPNIELLSLTLVPVHNIFLAMEDDPAFGKDNKFDPAPEPQPYFPALFSIVLDNIDFEEGDTVAVDDTIYSICWALNCRPFAHFVEEVRLVNCVNFGQAEFDRFRDSTNPVIDIHWDGHGGGAGPDGDAGQVFEVQSGDPPGGNRGPDSVPA